MGGGTLDAPGPRRRPDQHAVRRGRADRLARRGPALRHQQPAVPGRRRAARIPGLSLYIDALFLVETAFTDRLGVSVLGGLGHDKVLVSELRDGRWTPPRRLDEVPGEPPIESAFNDHCLFVSPDGREAFWSSDRPGGYGDNDIWTSRKVGGAWTRPENMGPSINGPYSDHHSMLGPDGRTLYVTSARPGGHGGEDIYVSTRAADGRWSPLVDLPTPVDGHAKLRVGGQRAPG